MEVGETNTVEETITEEDVKMFAEASGDENPLHTDEDYASETFFGSRIAHGMLVSGVISKSLADIDGLVVYKSQELEFKNPVYIGSTVTASCTLISKDEEANEYVFDTVVKTEDGDVAIEGTATVMIQNK